MIPSPAGAGTTGQPWSRRRDPATCARRLSKAIHAAAAARAGIKMSKKYNTESTNHGGARVRPTVIDQIHDEWCLANGYKLSSKSRQAFKPSREGSSLSPKSTSSRIREPG